MLWNSIDENSHETTLGARNSSQCIIKMTTIRQCHSVDMSHNSSCLDHLLLSRGDSTSACVFGDARCGIQYGLLAIDYILCKLLSNQRYRRVICICFDRRSDSIISTAEAYFAQLQVKWQLISYSDGNASTLTIIASQWQGD